MERDGADWERALALAKAHAPFLAQALERQPGLEELLARGEGEAALDWARRRAFGELEDQVRAPDLAIGETMRALRKERLALACALAIGDLAGAFSLERVMGELSDFADRALNAAIRSAIAARVGEDALGAPLRGFGALALGKLGARELNFSSDIDPILLYDPQSLPRRTRDEPGEAAQRYAREIVRILSENTADGYVFRVDLRLRPASEISPLAISFDAALSHYESMALPWERAAFIRARACAGDVAALDEFLKAIRPFVWRRSLDFGAIDEIRALTRRIRANYSGPDRVGEGFDLKRGRGGIREVEFFAQTHQLIHGGRDRSLRLRGTREALDALARAGRIEAQDAQTLGEAYDFLRKIEHRIQMTNDRQTHALPGGQALEELAKLSGFGAVAELVAPIEAHCASVARLYDRLIEEDGAGEAGDAHGPALIGRLEQLGFEDPPALARRIESWRSGKFQSLRSNAALRAFDRLLPKLLEAFAAGDDRERALIHWERLLARVSSAINLFHLLDARPALLEQLVDVLNLAPSLAEELARRPALLDSLIDRSALDLPGSVEEIAARIEEGGDFDTPQSYEALLDSLRIVTSELRFALGLQLIENIHDPLDIAAALARTAEAGLKVAHKATERQFAQRHGRIAGGELVVLGLGRLGGGALTHASDLDLVYLFTGESGAMSDGERALSASHYFNRLAQRLSAALSVPTAEGALYEIDTRLRPQGAQGPLAVTFDSFMKYQREDAWTWEHMALARARPVAGSSEVCAMVAAGIAQVLGQERDPERLRADVLEMRAQMAQHKPAQGPLDAKLARGGLVDLEFLVHFLQLRDRLAHTPDLRRALVALVDARLLDEALIEAHDFLTRLLVSSRLLAPDLQIPAPAAARALARACGCDGVDPLLRALAKARQEVAANWRRTFGEDLEIQPFGRKTS